VFLPCQPIDLLILSFELPQPIYYIFTSYHSYRLVGHHSCYVSPLSLPLYSLGFLSPFISSLPLITPMSLLPYSLGFLSPFTTSLPLITLMGLLATTPTLSTQISLPLYSSGFLCPIKFTSQPLSFTVGHPLLPSNTPLTTSLNLTAP